MGQIVIIGGGAAGFFAAITCAEANPEHRVVLFERGKDVLGKVKISGGGRCNLTHACFDPTELVKFYPRGSKALLGPFYSFNAENTIDWFESRGVATKTEADGRMFPKSNTSESIVKCLLESAKAANVIVKTSSRVETIYPPKGNHKSFLIKVGNEKIEADKVMIASGSNPKMWKLLERLGHRIVKPVPSLFTFNIKDERLAGLAGLSLPNVEATIPGTDLSSNGPILITHWGLSGPAILKLSAWGARILHDKNYKFKLQINLIPELTKEMLLQKLRETKLSLGKKQVNKQSLFQIPGRWWKKLVQAAKISEHSRWADLSKKQLQGLLNQLNCFEVVVNGKSTFKEEFVTAGGVDLSEINFRRFESKVIAGLYMAGEVLNIDAITGGFNFQAAWTGGYLAGLALAE